MIVTQWRVSADLSIKILLSFLPTRLQTTVNVLSGMSTMPEMADIFKCVKILTKLFLIFKNIPLNF